MEVDPGSPEIRGKIKELQEQVDQYSSHSTHKSSKGFLSSFSFNLNSIYVYITIPIVILILLLVLKPSFIKIEYETEDNIVVKKMSFQKLIMWTLILGVVLDLGLFGFNYKMRKSKQS